MISVEPFRIEHIDEISPHPAQAAAVKQQATAEYREQLQRGVSYTFRIDGRIAFCGGVLDLYEDKRIGHVWTLLADWAPRRLMLIHGVASRLIDLTGKQMLVATTLASCPMPCRWMRMLGFKFDHVEENYGDSGEAHAIYVRVF